MLEESVYGLYWREILSGKVSAMRLIYLGLWWWSFPTVHRDFFFRVPLAHVLRCCGRVYHALCDRLAMRAQQAVDFSTSLGHSSARVCSAGAPVSAHTPAQGNSMMLPLCIPTALRCTLPVAQQRPRPWPQGMDWNLLDRWVLRGNMEWKFALLIIVSLLVRFMDFIYGHSRWNVVGQGRGNSFNFFDFFNWMAFILSIKNISSTRHHHRWRPR